MVNGLDTHLRHRSYTYHPSHADQNGACISFPLSALSLPYALYCEIMASSAKRACDACHRRKVGKNS